MGIQAGAGSECSGTKTREGRPGAGLCSVSGARLHREVSGHIRRGLRSPKSLATMQRGEDRQRDITTLFMSRFYPRTSHFPLKEKLIYIYRFKLSRPTFERKKRSSAINLKFALNSHLPRESGLRSPRHPGWAACPPV